MAAETDLLCCPVCGIRSFARIEEKQWGCGGCGFLYYHNTASAVVAVVEHEGKILVTERKKKPAAGTLDLPGGFVDNRETLEAALVREIREELNLEVTDLKYLCSFPNAYPFGGIRYWTVDAFFTCRPRSVDGIRGRDEIARWFWADIRTMNPDDFGFESIRRGLAFYLRTIRPRNNPEKEDP